MKKENYGIPAMLLCVAIYAIGLYSALGTVWPIVAVTVAVFALQFDSRVKKTAVQALGLALIITAVYIVFNVVDVFKGIVDTYGTRTYGDSTFDKLLSTLEYILKLGTYVLYGVLIICSAFGNDIFVGKVHMVVDGFVPVKQVPQQPMYGAQPMQAQQINRQPMNGQPMNGQMNNQQMNRQPVNGQPMNNQQMNRQHVEAQSVNNQQMKAQPVNNNQVNRQHAEAQPMNNAQMNGSHVEAQSMNNQSSNRQPVNNGQMNRQQMSGQSMNAQNVYGSQQQQQFHTNQQPYGSVQFEQNSNQTKNQK